MTRVMVRYRVKPDRAAENVELVRAVYAELHSTRPAGLRYGTLRLEDGVSFVHIAETEDGSNPLASTEAFQQFQNGISERCDEAPVVSEVELVGSYGLFGDGDENGP